MSAEKQVNPPDHGDNGAPLENLLMLVLLQDLPATARLRQAWSGRHPHAWRNHEAGARQDGADVQGTGLISHHTKAGIHGLNIGWKSRFSGILKFLI
jgi:hypothetical protein